MKTYYCDLCKEKKESSKLLIVTSEKRIYPCKKCMAKVEKYLELSTFGRPKDGRI